MFLRDRKKTDKFTRWVALIMVIVFALGFVLLSVGSSAGGNVLLACEQEDSSVSADSYQVQQETFYKNNIAANPQDTVSMLRLAQLYMSEYFKRYAEANGLLEQVIAIEPGNITARLEQARLNMDPNVLNNPDEGLRLLTEAAAIAPDNAEVFLQLGLAAKSAGQNAQAIDAWNRYLALDPQSNLADTIRGEIAVLQTLPPVTPKAEPAIEGTAPVEGAGAPPALP